MKIASMTRALQRDRSYILKDVWHEILVETFFAKEMRAIVVANKTGGYLKRIVAVQARVRCNLQCNALRTLGHILCRWTLVRVFS